MNDVPLQLQIGLQIMYLRRIATVELNARLAPLNASSPMYSILLRLSNDADVAQSELATDAALDPAGVSRLINRLANEGVVKVSEDPNDRRVRRVSLTPKGRKLERSLAPVVTDTLARTFNGLEEHEQRQLLALLKKGYVAPGSEGGEEAESA